ncbi:MAG: carbamate kinase [Candidatus Micrarchaeaceae archaeon]
MMQTVVIGLGGNALLSPSGRQSAANEERNAAKVAIQIAKIAKTGRYRMIITHGNGPQIGDELARNVAGSRSVPMLPFHIMSSETEAQIGTVLELALRNRLAGNADITTVLTHVLVDEHDGAFRNPTKPIGPFHDRRLHGGTYKKFPNGYRMVVPSPRPKRILETDSIKALSKGGIVIACGGGGIPVVKTKHGYKGVTGVIDKDATTQLLATSVKADIMMLLTNVDYVYSDYKRRSGRISAVKADVLMRNIERFEAGTMRPKVRAGADFVRNGGNACYIGSLDKLGLILSGRSGTKIT